MADYLGIDVGTTNIKAAVYDDKGQLKDLAVCPTPKVETGKYAGYEYNPDDLFERMADCLQKLHDTCGSVRALAVSSMGESGILLDGSANALTNAIPWFDPRTIPQAKRVADGVGGDKELFSITGQIPSSKFGITKLLWYMDNQPKIFEKAKYWMSINDYILYRLCGIRICDYSIAARTMAFDIRNLRWSKEICDAAGISSEMFGTPVPGGTGAGPITKESAARTGLPLETMVVTGGHDHLCALVGAGALGEASMLSSMGTSEVTVFTMKEPITTEDLFLRQCCVSPHCSSRLYRVFSSMQACGASIEWFLDGIGEHLSKQAETLGLNRFSYLDTIAEACPGDDRLLYFPLIRGSLLNPDAGGLFTGIRDNHRLGHFARALLDGLCCEFTWQTENCSTVLKKETRSVQVVGGPARSNFMMRRKADISGLIVEVPSQREAACYGASLLAAVGSGDISFDELEQRSDVSSRRILPVPGGGDVYRRYQAVRKMVDELNRQQT
jgi:xylulokinase